MGNQIGGAMNAEVARQAVERGVLPSKEAVSSQAFFNEYYFDTESPPTEALLAPSYSFARCIHPITEEVETYVAVGLDSVEDGKNRRNNLNLVIVLDISGSMKFPFDFSAAHYMSGFGEGADSTSQSPTKMKIATEVIVELIGTLREGDNFGVVLFDDRVQVLQPVRSYATLQPNFDELRERVLAVQPRGGTNMALGIRAALDMLRDLRSEDVDARTQNDSRIMFLTDANPNLGGGKDTLLGLTRDAAKRDAIYTTFVGVGLDFNLRIVDALTRCRGCNYFSVRNREHFQRILVEDFNYIVTPIVFDALLFFESDALEIEKSYGTPEESEGGGPSATGCLLKIDTMMGSPKGDQGIKGGIVLLKLKEKLTPQLDPSKLIKFTLRYKDRHQNVHQETHEVDFGKELDQMIGEGKIYASPGVRKAVLLARYSDYLKDLIDDVSNEARLRGADDGVAPPPRRSVPLDDSYGAHHVPTREIKMAEETASGVLDFKRYLKAEAGEIGDSQLLKELDMLDRIRYSRSRE